MIDDDELVFKIRVNFHAKLIQLFNAARLSIDESLSLKLQNSTEFKERQTFMKYCETTT